MSEATEKSLGYIMKNNQLEDFVILNDEISKDKEVLISAPSSSPDRKPVPCEVNYAKIAFLYIQGYTEEDIAAACNVTRDDVHRMKHSNKFKALLEAITKEVVSTSRVFLMASGLKAVRTLLMCMDSDDDRVKLKAATEVLDRVGLKSPEEINLVTKSENLHGMSETELLGVIRLGMKEIMPISEDGYESE